VNEAEEDLNEDFRLVGEKIKGALDYYRDQQADYEQKAEALHEAWDKWDLDALVSMGVITEEDRDKLKPPTVRVYVLGIAPNDTSGNSVGGYEWVKEGNGGPKRLLEYLATHYDSGCDYRIVTISVPEDWTLQVIDKLINDNPDLWNPQLNKTEAVRELSEWLRSRQPS